MRSGFQWNKEMDLMTKGESQSLLNEVRFPIQCKVCKKKWKVSQSLLNEVRFPIQHCLKGLFCFWSQSLLNEVRFPIHLKAGYPLLWVSQSLLNEVRFPMELEKDITVLPFESQSLLNEVRFPIPCNNNTAWIIYSVAIPSKWGQVSNAELIETATRIGVAIPSKWGQVSNLNPQFCFSKTSSRNPF